MNNSFNFKVGFFQQFANRRLESLEARPRILSGI